MTAAVLLLKPLYILRIYGRGDEKMSVLPTNLVKKFIKETDDSDTTESQSQFYGTTSVNSDGIYVTLDGATTPTPISMATDAEEGDRVLVEIVDHKARILQTTEINKISLVKESAEEALKKATEVEVTADGISAKVSEVESTADSALEKATEVEVTASGLSTKVSEIEGDYQKSSTMEQTVKGFTWTVTSDDIAAVEQDAADALAAAEDAESTANSAQSTANSASSTASSAYSTASNASKVATNYLSFSSSGLIVGDMTSSTLGKNVLIDSDGVNIRNGSTVLASFSANAIYLGKEWSTGGFYIDTRRDDVGGIIQEIVSTSELSFGAGYGTFYFSDIAGNTGLTITIEGSSYSSGRTATLTSSEITISGQLNVTGDIYKKNNPITTSKELVWSSQTLAASTSTTFTKTFTLSSPYRCVTGVRALRTNKKAVTIDRFYISGDGSTGNTVTVDLYVTNSSSTKYTDLNLRCEVGLSV